MKQNPTVLGAVQTQAISVPFCYLTQQRRQLKEKKEAWQRTRARVVVTLAYNAKQRQTAAFQKAKYLQ